MSDTELIIKVRRCFADCYGYPPETPGVQMRLFLDEVFLEYLLVNYGVTTVINKGYEIDFKVIDEHKYTVFLLKYL